MGMKALKIFKKKLISMQADIVVNLNWKLMLNMKFGVHSKSSCLKVAFLTWKIQLKMLWKHDQTIHDLKLYKITLSMKKVFQDAYKSIYTSQLLNRTYQAYNRILYILLQDDNFSSVISIKNKTRQK